MAIAAAAIVGCSGETLNAWEREFFRDLNPHGFILFARNCTSPEQIRALCDALRDTVGRVDAPILIDQEGGRVARLRAPHWLTCPPMQVFGDLAAHDRVAAERALRANIKILCHTLLSVNVNVNCVPVLDVPVAGSHDIIGDRAFSYDPNIVAQLGTVVVDECLQCGVLPIIKHIPGHGRALADSHIELPRVDTDAATLRATDFVPFIANKNAPWAMLAHVVYSAFDAVLPASISPTIINLIRTEMGYDGILLADDLSMQALSGPYCDRAAQTLAAGADLALHCNGDKDEMLDLANGLQPLRADTIARLQRTKLSAWDWQSHDLASLIQTRDTLLLSAQAA